MENEEVLEAAPSATQGCLQVTCATCAAMVSVLTCVATSVLLVLLVLPVSYLCCL